MHDTLVRRRVELKYTLSPAEAEGLLARLPSSKEDSPYAHRVGRVSTVYFDRPDRAFMERAISSPAENVKIRLREYLGEDGAPASPLVWIEMKERSGETSGKRRFQLHNRMVEPFLRGDLDLPMIQACQDRSTDPAEVAETVRRIAELAEGPLAAVGTVTYRRTSFESRQPRARLTVDQEITYHRGDRVLSEPRTIVEVKGLGEMPPLWCRPILGGASAEEYSKFLILARL